MQMPRGVPVATVAIGNAANAGLLAVRILAATDPSLLQKMLNYQVCSTQKLSAFATDEAKQYLPRMSWEEIIVSSGAEACPDISFPQFLTMS